MKIQYPKDWGKISNSAIISLGGSSVLSHNGDSLFNSLQSLYPSIYTIHLTYW